MPSTLNYPFKSSGFSVQRNEILTVQPPYFTHLLQGDGASTSFAVISGEGKKPNLNLSDVQVFRVFEESINGAEFQLDNIVGDPSFAAGGEYYYTPPQTSDDSDNGTLTFAAAPQGGAKIVVQYFPVDNTGNADPSGILQSLAKDLTLHPYRNDYSESWSSNQQKKSTATIDLATNFTDQVGSITATDSLGAPVNFDSGDIGKRVREKYGNGVFLITSITGNIADIIVISPKSDSSTTSYAGGEWMLIIPSAEVEPQPYNIIYPRVQDSDINYPSINFDGQQSHTSVMDCIRRIGSVFVVESEKGTDILSSLKDIDSSNTFVPTTAVASQVAQENRTPQKWRMRFFYDSRDEYIHVNIGTKFQILDDGSLSETVGRDGIASGPTRSPGELSDVYYKFDEKGNKAKSGFYRRQGKTDANIAGSYPISYRLTCSDHGTAFFIQDQASIDDDDYAWFVVQRHVNNISGKIDLEDGKSPVHCVYAPSKRPTEASDFNIGFYASYSAQTFANGKTVIETTDLGPIYKTDGTQLTPETPIQFSIITDKDPVAVSAAGTSYYRGTSYRTPPSEYDPLHEKNISDYALGAGNYELPLGTNYSIKGSYNKLMPPDSGLSTAGDMLGYPYAQTGTPATSAPTDAIQAFDQEYAITSYATAGSAGIQLSNPDGLRYVPKKLNTLSLSRQEQLGPAESGLAPYQVQALDVSLGGSSRVATLVEGVDYIISKETDDYWHFQFKTVSTDNIVPNMYVSDTVEGPNMLGANSSSSLELARHCWFDESGKIVEPQKVLLNGAIIPSSHYEITQHLNFTVKLSGYSYGAQSSADITFDGGSRTATVSIDSQGQFVLPLGIELAETVPFAPANSVILEASSIGQSANVVLTIDTVSATTTANPTFNYIRGDSVQLGNSDILEIRSYFSPENTKIILFYVWNGAGYRGEYVNSFGGTSQIRPQSQIKPLYEVNRLDVFVNGVEINSSPYPSGYVIDSSGDVSFRDISLSLQNEYVYSVAQDTIYVKNQLVNGEQLKFSYENYNSTEETDSAAGSYLFELPEDRDIPNAWSNLHKETIAIYRFVVRESDVLKPWDFHVSATIPQVDSPAIINPQEQLSITQDKTFVFTFPSPLTTQKFIYPNSEMDLLCYSGASSSTLGGFTSIGTSASPKYDLDGKQVSLATDITGTYTLDSGPGSAPSGTSVSEYTSSNADVLNYRDIYPWHTGSDTSSTSASRSYVGMQSTQSYGNGMRIFVLVRGGPINPIYSDFVVRL
jgi:hypothetical protein